MKGPESGLEAAENQESHEGFWEEVRVDGSCSQEVMYQAAIHHVDAQRGRSQQTTSHPEGKRMAAKGIEERVNWRDHTKAELIEVSQDYI